MELIEQLRREHQMIDQVAGALLRAAHDIEQVDDDDVEAFVGFFRDFVHGFHHRSEEDVLFPALVEYAEVPGDRGPIAVLSEEHQEMKREVDAFAKGGRSFVTVENVRRLVEFVWEHIDKENSVTLPEAKARLRRGGMTRMPAREADSEALEAFNRGRTLVETFPPMDDPTIVRGDGCIACSAFAETCSGIESEWWNTWERQYYRSIDEG